jgi:hypothetical protein
MKLHWGTTAYTMHDHNIPAPFSGVQEVAYHTTTDGDREVGYNIQRTDVNACSGVGDGAGLTDLDVRSGEGGAG